MSSSTRSAGASGSRIRLRTVGLAASLTAAAVGASLALAPGAAVAGPVPAGPASPVTRAAIAPALTAGTGADLGITEQEAETAATNGTIIGPSTAAYTLPAEASGRSAVQLSGAGEYVQFTLPKAANGLTVRYSIPDAPTGGGITAPIDLIVNGRHVQTPTLTSQYAWLYNVYPFTNDPNAVADAPAPGDWITECSCVPDAATAASIPTPFRPNHFYDEQRILLDHVYQAGSTVRFQVPVGSAITYTIDLLDSQLVAPPKVDLRAADVLLFGADPTGRRDSADAIDRAIAFAQRWHLPVYVPPGTYQVNRHIIVDNVTIEGAGSWYTIFKGHQVTLATPAPDGSVHTGVGFYGKYAADGGSTNVHLRDFAIEGDVRDRVDTDQVNGIGGALSDSTVDGVYIQHTKAGIWIDGPANNLQISNVQEADLTADGVNFHTGVTNSSVTNSFIRNTGDDALAMWSDQTEDAKDTFAHDTVQTPVLANGVALYGGTDNTVAYNLIADPIREGSAIQLGSRFGSQAFTGHAWITGNTTVRAGTFELNWQIGLGAIWIYALEKNINADVEVTGDNFLDNTYDAIMMVSDYSVKDLYSITNVHFTNVHVDGAGTDVVSARSAGNATFQNVDVRNIGWWGVNNCGSFNFLPTGSEFSLTDLGGNDGIDNDAYHLGTNWLTPYLPNAITCNDRPPVIPPPAPSAW